MFANQSSELAHGFKLIPETPPGAGDALMALLNPVFLLVLFLCCLVFSAALILLIRNFTEPLHRKLAELQDQLAALTPESEPARPGEAVAEQSATGTE